MKEREGGREGRERIRQELIAAPRVVAALVAAVRTQVPAYAALDDERLREVRAIASWALERMLHLWATDGALTPRTSGGCAASRRPGPRTAGRCRRSCGPTGSR
ncbi:hypothetical protein PQR15_03550 [Streptomyces lydicus]|nr:hypothetical protein [Streptomyces lydicus]